MPFLFTPILNLQKQCHVCGCGGPRIEEGIIELLLLLLRHHNPEEGIHTRIGGEGTKDFWELLLERTGCGERIMEGRGSFEWKVAYCLHIKWLAIALSAVLIRKWHEQWNSQLNSPFYHLKQKLKGAGVMMRIWVGGAEGSRCEVLRSI